MRDVSGANLVIGHPDGESFAALAKAFADSLQGRGLSPATVKVRMCGLSVLQRYVEREGIDDVRQMTRTQVDAYMVSLRGQRLSPRTIENWLGTLKRFFGFLVESNRLLLSPAEHLRERNLGHIIGPTISAVEAERLLTMPNTDTPLGARNRAILEVMYGTGLRRSELVALDVADVDLAQGILSVREGKGGKDRLVPLGRQAIRWLEPYIANVRPGFCQGLHGPDGGTALWLGRDGARLSRESVALIVRTAGRAAGLRVSCHTLRRTMATEMLRGGASLPEVAKLLGHAHLSATQRYTKVACTDLQRIHREKHPRGG
jgi:integrase/recombinase XerD